MAGVEAISMGSISLTGMPASQGTASVSTEGTQQFEQFLKKGDSTQQSEQSLEPVREAQDSAYAVNRDYAKREDLTTSQTGETTELPADEAEAMAALEEGIRDVIKENLGMDDEMLDAVLQSMGIVVTDLLNPAVLQQFVLFVNGGEESTDFLMNEEMLQCFTDVMQAMEEFKSENQNLLLPMLEKLENPVTLEEFLQQEGIELNAVTAGTEDVQSSSAVEGQEALVQANVDVDEQKAVVKSVDAEEQVVVKEVVTKDSQNTEESADVKLTVQNVSENATDAEEETSQDFMQNSQTSQDANEVLFAQRDTLTGEERIATPLFADKFNSFLQDGIRFLNAETGATQRMQQMIDIVNQVSEQIRTTVNADTSSVEMQLNPESLGKVNISIVAKNGVMTATFNVQSEEAKNALESQILTLRENLEAKNLKVEAVEVQVSDFTFGQSNQAEGQNQKNFETKADKKFRYDSGEDTEAVDEVNAEAVRRQVMRDSGSSIDFTA